MLKTLNKTIITFILLITVIFSIKTNAYVRYPLDRIDLYEITINPRDNGTLDMEFNIEWTVLDSTTEGPLEWVKIGIPNYSVSNIKGLSSCIENIYYYSSFGSYIRIDLDRQYHSGETVNIIFSYNQSRMYFLTNDKCSYHYRPGYFDEIEVTKAIVRWKKQNVINHNFGTEVGDYLVWEDSLGFGESIEVRVEYYKTAFADLDPNKQFTNDYLSPRTKKIIWAVVITIIVIIIVIYIIQRRKRDPYLSERGFIGRRYYRWRFWFGRHRRYRYYNNGYFGSGYRVINPTPPKFTSSGSGSSGGFSCACACACAGGGRAGCSRKDFYQTNLQTDKVLKHLKNE